MLQHGSTADRQTYPDGDIFTGRRMSRVILGRRSIPGYTQAMTTANVWRFGRFTTDQGNTLCSSDREQLRVIHLVASSNITAAAEQSKVLPPAIGFPP